MLTVEFFNDPIILCFTKCPEVLIFTDPFFYLFTLKHFFGVNSHYGCVPNK